VDGVRSLAGDPQEGVQQPAADVQTAYSPTGKFIVTRSQRRAGFEADRL
jgi:hypothetical protein